MTRINLVDPTDLYDQHLMAEYRELPRVFTMVKSWESKGLNPKKINIPGDFTLGSGHIKFFANKLSYLRQRYDSIVLELKNRGFNIQHNDLGDKASGISSIWFNEYAPEDYEINISKKRIQERIDMKPNWYRKTKHARQ